MVQVRAPCGLESNEVHRMVATEPATPILDNPNGKRVGDRCSVERGIPNTDEGVAGLKDQAVGVGEREKLTTSVGFRTWRWIPV